MIKGSTQLDVKTNETAANHNYFGLVVVHRKAIAMGLITLVAFLPMKD